MGCPLSPGAGLETVGELGWESAAAYVRLASAMSNRSRSGAERPGPEFKKSTPRRARDGIRRRKRSEPAPHRCRTWAPRGHAPILEYRFNWKSLSAVAGLTALSFYFRLYAEAIKSPEVVDFLQALVRHLRRPLILAWNRLPAHRSAIVRVYLDSLQGQIHMEYLPSYASELNPVEYIGAYWKQHELPNVCPKDFWQLGEAAHRTPRLITAFWQQASLWPTDAILCEIQ